MTVEIVAALEDRLRAAMVDNDLKVLDELIDDGLLFAIPTGEVLGKSDDLEARRSGATRMVSLTPSDQRIAVHGDSAVVTVRMEMTGEAGGDQFLGTFRYVRFWRRMGTGWRVVGGSVTRLPTSESSD